MPTKKAVLSVRKIFTRTGMYGILFLFGLLGWSGVIHAESINLDLSSYADRGYREVIGLNGTWKLSDIRCSKTKPEDDEGMQLGFWKKSYDDSAWSKRKVPQSWYIKTPDGQGVNLGKDDAYTLGWYRKEFLIPAEHKGKRAILHFEQVEHDCQVWLNGHKVGEHQGAYTPFEFDVTPDLISGDTNTVALRVTDNIVSGVWWGKMAGIIQPVELIFKPDVYIERVCINPRITTSSIDVEMLIHNTTGENKKYELTALVSPAKEQGDGAKGSAEVTTQGLGGIDIAPGAKEYAVNIKLKNPNYWWPDNPFLYDLFLVLRDSKTIIECNKTRFGFREFTTKGRFFYLNGKKMYLFGGQVFPKDLVHPDKQNDPLYIRDFLKTKIKDRNFNMIRTAGMPAPSLFYKIADELGVPIYNEWALFAGRFSMDKEVFFIPQILTEMREWIYRDYNHPSVMMWSLANEEWHRAPDVLNKLYLNLRPLDKSGRPMVTSQADGLWGSKIETDAFDVHCYRGFGGTASWTFLEEYFIQYQEWVRKLYGESNKPVISWENVLWQRDPNVAPDFLGKVDTDHLSVEQYLQYVNYRKTVLGWGDPSTFIRTVGLRTYLKDGFEAYNTRLLKRVVEVFRRSGDLTQGVAPFGNGYAPEYLKLFYRPLYVCTDLFNQNVFAGKKMEAKIYALNDSLNTAEGVRVRIQVSDSNGKSIQEDTKELGTINQGERQVFPYEWSIPSDLGTGFYKLNLAISCGGKEAADNTYEFYILGTGDLSPKIETDKKVAVYSPAGLKNTRVEGILSSLKIQYQKIEDLENLNKFDVLIIPEYYAKNTKEGDSWTSVNPNIEKIGADIRQWIEKGGKLLSFEQSLNGVVPWADEMETYDVGVSTFVDLVVPNHPVFNKLARDNFDVWDNKDGEIARFCIGPLNKNVIISGGTQTNGWGTDIIMFLMETKIGSGYVLMSQLDATRGYGINSAATKYIQNLLNYVLADGEGRKDIEQLQGKRLEEILNKEECFYVDLSKYVNMGFRDEVKDDRKGGWTDQGPDNDLRDFPVGMNVFAGVPYNIIDPTKNNGASCIVLKGGPNDYFPDKIENIKIGQKAGRLYFLHASAWTPVDADDTAQYIIYYSDGTKETIPVKSGLNIADWWSTAVVKEARIAWRGHHSAGIVGLYTMVWTNTYPEKVIDRMDFISFNKAIPILVAVTALKTKEN